jgi:hypothetical protein
MADTPILHFEMHIEQLPGETDEEYDARGNQLVRHEAILRLQEHFGTPATCDICETPVQVTEEIYICPQCGYDLRDSIEFESMVCD